MYLSWNFDTFLDVDVQFRYESVLTLYFRQSFQYECHVGTWSSQL